MADKPKLPQNIFEVINENINVTNENVLALIKKVTSIEQEIIALRMMFNVPVPEKPNASGEESAGNGVSKEQSKTV